MSRKRRLEIWRRVHTKRRWLAYDEKDLDEFQRIADEERRANDPEWREEDDDYFDYRFGGT